MTSTEHYGQIYLFFSNITSTKYVAFNQCTNGINRIDVWQGINVGPGKFIKKNICRALNKHRAWIKCAKLCYKKLANICRLWKKLQNLINVGPLIMLYGLEKYPKLIKSTKFHILWTISYTKWLMWSVMNMKRYKGLRFNIFISHST
jgi:hypothetical protein